MALTKKAKKYKEGFQVQKVQSSYNRFFAATEAATTGVL